MATLDDEMELNDAMDRVQMKLTTFKREVYELYWAAQRFSLVQNEQAKERLDKASKEIEKWF